MGTAGAFLASHVDMMSLLFAIVYGLLRTLKTHGKILSRATGLSIANGIAIFPLALMVLSGFWTDALNAVLQSNKVILSIAGIVALLAILEYFAEARPRSTRTIGQLEPF